MKKELQSTCNFSSESFKTSSKTVTSCHRHIFVHLKGTTKLRNFLAITAKEKSKHDENNETGLPQLI